VRGSFDHFKDQKAIQVLSAFLMDCRLILAHEEIAAATPKRTRFQRRKNSSLDWVFQAVSSPLTP